jgi:hypothetical protein
MPVHAAKLGWTKKTQRTIRMAGLAEAVVVARDDYQCARDVAERLSRAYTGDRANLSAHLLEKWGAG